MRIQQDPRLPSDTRSQVKIAHRHAASLKIVVPLDTRYGPHSASEAIVEAAHGLHLAQPIVTGITTRYRRLVARLLRIEPPAFVTLEFIDSRDKLEALASLVRRILPGAMISWETLEMWVPFEVIE